MTGTIVKFPDVWRNPGKAKPRVFNLLPAPSGFVRRRIAVDLTLSPEHWKRLERIAWDACTNTGFAIAAIVSVYLADEEAKVSEKLDGEGEV